MWSFVQYILIYHVHVFMCSLPPPPRWWERRRGGERRGGGQENWFGKFPHHEFANAAVLILRGRVVTDFPGFPNWNLHFRCSGVLVVFLLFWFILLFNKTNYFWASPGCKVEEVAEREEVVEVVCLRDCGGGQANWFFFKSIAYAIWK